MKIHEFQGKELFRRYGIAVPKGQVARTPEEALNAARALECTPVVVKAQIHAGGRGKGFITSDPQVRGVKVVADAKAAEEHAAKLLGHHLRTHQTGIEGQTVKQVLVEAGSSIAKELYVGLVLDRETSQVTLIASTEGGMDIEEVAAKTPEKILKQSIHPVSGYSAFHGRNLAFGLGLKGDLNKQAVKIFGQLYKLFVELDCSLLEVNPLVVTKDDKLLALDAKVNFDDNALFRHPDILVLRDVDEEDPKERRAKDNELSYVALSGNIGCLVNGAGLAMGTMDIIKFAGGEPANFLDVGGSATQAQVSEAFKIILADPAVKAILINIFGGIAKCDVIASGVVAAAKEVNLAVPLVVRLEGTNVELGRKILSESGLKITTAGDMLDAAQKVVAAIQSAA